VTRRMRLGIAGLVAWTLASALAAASLVGLAHPASAQAGIVIGKAHAGYAPSLDGDPIVILMIGSGAREGEDVMHSLADSIHVVSIDPETHKATIVGIPRDSWVPIAGFGTAKINSSLVDGGPDLLVQTVESLSGLTIDYWAITTFWGITDLVDELGGLTVDVPFQMDDYNSGSSFEPGTYTLNGRQTLQFARDRHSFAQGDFARSENGGRILLAFLAQFRKAFQKDQSALFPWIAAGMKNVDASMPIDEAIDLAYTASHVNPNKVRNVVLPGTAGMQGSLSVVFLASSSAAAIFDDIAPDAVLSKANVPPSPTANET
jgi:polyisoprenyl-teichoic acid--peptidoglycan teichoic acid transferase